MQGHRQKKQIQIQVGINYQVNILLFNVLSVFSINEIDGQNFQHFYQALR